jgi:hypothetical protein
VSCNTCHITSQVTGSFYYIREYRQRIDKKGVSRHKRKTRMNKNGHEMRKKSKKGYKAEFKS